MGARLKGPRLKRPAVKLAERPQGYSQADQDTDSDSQPYDQQTDLIGALGPFGKHERTDTEEASLTGKTAANVAAQQESYVFTSAAGVRLNQWRLALQTNMFRGTFHDKVLSYLAPRDWDNMSWATQPGQRSLGNATQAPPYSRSP